MLVALLCLAAAGLATACGSSSSDEPVVPAPPPAGDTRAAITIQAPAGGARLRAKQSDGGALRAPVRVRGRARAGSEVLLDAACRPEPCRAQARAGDDGSWATTLTLSVPREVRFVTIDAGARSDQVGAGAAVVTVELVGAARNTRARRPAARSGSPGRRASAQDEDGAASQRPSSRRALAKDVLVIGDSLAVGIEQPLKEALSGWRVRVDGRIGRPLGEGMGILARQPAPPAILAFSLFTNDGPRNTPALEAAVRATAARQRGCAVWATVVRPPLKGVSYDAANALLRRLADDPALTLQLVDWAAEVARSPSLVVGDRVHGTPAGYRVLAQLYAEAIRSCAGAG